MPKKIRASHILVKTEQEALAAKFDVSHGKSFEEVAMALSLCPSKKKGGDLGFFSKGMMVKEFENAAFLMKKDEISKPVKSQFGWHIIKVTDVQ